MRHNSLKNIIYKSNRFFNSEVATIHSWRSIREHYNCFSYFKIKSKSASIYGNFFLPQRFLSTESKNPTLCLPVVNALLEKVTSIQKCPSVVEEIVNFGVHYQQCSTQIGLGKFSHNFIRDINWLWKNVLTQIQKDHDVEEILILDHGGHALTFIPEQILQKYKVVGVEKTTGGLINLENQGMPPFPLIGVAHCAAKKILESPLIAEAVVTKLLPLIPIRNANLICGVVGYGAIGKSVATKLLALGHKVIIFDNDSQQLKNITSKDVTVTTDLSALVAFSDYIFGCTGRDITTSLDIFRLSPKNKTLISCSSEDKEFLSLLHLIQRKKNGKVATQPLENIEYENDAGGIIRILRGGFPINFDNSSESVPAQDIQLTRALVLGSILQAIQFFKRPEILDTNFIYSLDSKIQKFVVNEWLKCQPTNRFSKKVIASFQDINWIRENSGGQDASKLTNQFLLPFISTKPRMSSLSFFFCSETNSFGKTRIRKNTCNATVPNI